MYEQPFNPYAKNVSVVKEYFKNSRVLVMGILYFVSLVISVVSSIYTMMYPTAVAEYYLQLFQQIIPELSELMQANGLSMEQLAASGSTGSIGSLVVSGAVTVLFGAAYLMIFVKSRSNEQNATPQAGVSILRVFAIISMIFMILGAFLIIAAVLILFAVSDQLVRELPVTVTLDNGASLSPRDLVTILLVVMAVIGVIYLFFGLFFTINRVRYYSSVRNSLTSIELQNKGAKPYGVLCIIFAILSAFSVLGSFVTLAAMRGPVWVIMLLSLLANLLSVVMTFIEGSIALGYKKHIDNYLNGYNNTPYGGVQDPGYVVPAVNNTVNPYAAPGQPDVNGYADYSAEQQPFPTEQPAYQDSYEAQGQDRQRVCPNCGAPVGDYPFCDNCGTKL